MYLTKSEKYDIIEKILNYHIKENLNEKTCCGYNCPC